MSRKRPIGIFDSGLGGLSVCRAINNILPKEYLMYFADLEFSPYGTKSKKSIEERSEYIVNFLIEQDCKLIVVACNTATVNSISMLRSKYAIPIIGVEPAIKPAALESKSGVMGDTKFWASGCSNKTANSISRLWGQEINLSSRE